MEELKLTGNHLKGSRPILTFSTNFDKQPHWKLLKELIMQVCLFLPFFDRNGFESFYMTGWNGCFSFCFVLFSMKYFVLGGMGVKVLGGIGRLGMPSPCRCPVLLHNLL